MKKLSQLQQEKTALEKRLDRYISKEVKASKAMKVGLIFKITSLEVKIEKLEHIVFGTGWWEGKGLDSPFIQSLYNAYQLCL